MAKIGVVKNSYHPSGWNRCDWSNRMRDAIGQLGHDLELFDENSLINNQTLFYLCRLNHDMGPKNSEQLSKNLEKIALFFETNNSFLFPDSYSYRLYENKKNINSLFENTGVKHPQSFYCTTKEAALLVEIEYPVVIKHPYSCASNFMQQANNRQEYESAINSFFSNNNECIIQRKISFTREARLTFVGDKVIHGYFRVKPNKESMSGSTKFGSVCDFNIDLDKMSKHVRVFRKLSNINIGAVDVAWENDDMDSDPYFFEVSPIFSMNAPGPSGHAYKSFKGTKEFKEKEKIIQLNLYKEIINFLIEKRQRPKIYCDIDGTINNHEVRVGKWYSNGNIDPRYGSYEEIMKDEPILEAREILNNAKEKYEIVYITARAKFDNAYLSTRDWLIKNNFHYDKIIITKNFEEKLDILKNDTSNYLFIDDLTRGHHTGNVEVKKDAVKKLIYNNIDFVRYNNNWEEIRRML